MKKSLILVGLLSIGYAHAQQYDGKVGVNTDTPSATLNVKSLGNTDKTKNLELDNSDGTKMVTVLDNGYVGINKVDPKGILDVYGTSIFRPKTKNDAVWILSNPAISGASGLIHTQIVPESAKSGKVGFKEYTLSTGSANTAAYVMSFISDLSDINTHKPLLSIMGVSGNVGIGDVITPTHKLHIKADADPLKLEGLKLSDSPDNMDDMIVVVNNDGVLKTIKKTSIGGNNVEQEWVYDDTDKRVNLRRSGGTLSDSKVFYNRNGAYINTNMDSYNYFDTNTKVPINVPLEYDLGYSDEYNKKVTNSTYLPKSGKNFQLLMKNNYVEVEDTSESGDNVFLSTFANTMRISPLNTKNYRQLNGFSSGINHDGTGDAKYLIGGSFGTRINRGKSTGYAMAARITASYATEESSKEQVGIYAYNQVLKSGAGVIDRMIDMGASTSFANTGGLSVREIKSLELSKSFTNIGNLNVTTAVGIEYQGIDATTKQNLTLTNNYGIKLGDIKGAATANYAIHTGAGQVRLGDLKGVGDRAVYVDADGVLKAGAAGTGLRTNGLWKREGSEVKLAVLSDGTDRTQENTVAINDKGEIYATSLKGKNGASIFPDYVFQKYYTGTSSIKADYTFKSLSQVEDFVKTNGHLPGYKSAEAIKAQGYIDVMETQVANVEKIEELYLHTIEQEKALKEKDAKIKSLEERLERLEKLIK